MILSDPLQAMLACCAEINICRESQGHFIEERVAAMVGEMDQLTELRRLIVNAKKGTT